MERHAHASTVEPGGGKPPCRVFLFAGQGSQHPHMARGLFDRNEVFRGWMERLDACARRWCGESVLAALYDPNAKRSDELDRLSISHPAIFMVEYAAARAVIAAGVRPDMLVGASLGSFAAAAVAEVIEPEVALEAVIQQAAALEACCEGGGMVAILDRFERHLPWLEGRCEVAAVNLASHFVVAAPETQLKAIQDELARQKVAFQRLPVRYPFHSAWIDDAEAPFAAYCASLRLASPCVRVVCCEQAADLEQIAPDFFWRVVRRPIRLPEAVAWLAAQGPLNCIDLSPSGTLATFFRHMPSMRHDIRAVFSRYGTDDTALERLAASPT